MTRGIIAIVWLVALALVPSLADGQQPGGKIRRIGFLVGSGDMNNPGPNVEIFRQGLRNLGYIEGKNILVEYRYGEGKEDRFPSLIDELVQLKVDVLVIPPLIGIRAAKQATKTIPIVMVTTQDPVATGIIDSLARPGGNITGVTRLTIELSGKRLELLKEVTPTLSRVGALWDAAGVGSAVAFKEYEVAARALKLQFQSLEVRGPSPDFEQAFRLAAKTRPGALVAIIGALFNRYQKRIADFAIKHRLPSMYERIDYVEAGGLMSYGANDAESFRRAAWYVDKILKGAKPAELPVEQPTKFEFAINLKTANQIGVTIPQSVLFRADKVIK